MLKKTAKAKRVCLDGDWSMSGVAERFSFLAKQLNTLAEPQPSEELQSCEASGLPEIDLSGINALDACGCQPLALFISNLRRCGKTPRITNIPDTFRSKIHLLGFDREFNLSY